MVNKKIRKSQMKIQQMAFMLLAVFLFFVLVGLIYLTISARNIKQLANEEEQNKIFLMSQFLSGSTEFSCSGTSQMYCIDTDKIMVLKNRTAYKNFFPVAYIQIRKIYPVMNDSICNYNNYPNCNLYNVYGQESGSSIGTFVALCRHESLEGYQKQVCELGRIIIGYKVKS